MLIMVNMMCREVCMTLVTDRRSRPIAFPSKRVSRWVSITMSKFIIQSHQSVFCFSQSLLDIVNIVYPAPHSSTTSPPTTMPALKTKTNLPKSNEDPSSLVDASEKKKKPYARKAPVNTDKQIIKKPKAKAQAKKGNAFPASDPPRGEGASTRRVEVVIDRVMEEEEVAPAVDDEEHIDHGQTVGHPLRHTKVVAPSMQGVEASFVSQNDEAEFWKGDDQVYERSH